MPLKLLSKKSWNVYAPENIARVKRDEAAAQAAEEEQDRLLQAYDAEKRLALLRGDEPPPPPPLTLDTPAKPARRRDDDRSLGRERKRKRVAGEDDTERDLRAAREDLEERYKAPPAATGKRAKKEAPITDVKGHINLFPVDPREEAALQKNAEVEAEKARKARELEDQYTMRLSNAAGRDGLVQKPWYAAASGREAATLPEDDKEQSVTLYADEKNAWGRPDPNRPSRDKARIMASDPLAFMSLAQQQLKKSERERKSWAEEREREMEHSRREGERKEKKERKERKEKRRRREERGQDDVGELEGFSLDGPRDDRSREHRDRDRRRDGRNRSRERDRARKMRHGHRSNSNRAG